MKALSRSAQQQKQFNQMVHLIQINLALTLIVLNKEFKFGTVRLHKFLDSLDETANVFKQYSKDDVDEYYICKFLEGAGLDPSEIFADPGPISKYRERKSVLSEKEIQQLPDNLNAYRAFIDSQKEDNENGSASVS